MAVLFHINLVSSTDFFKLPIKHMTLEGDLETELVGHRFSEGKMRKRTEGLYLGKTE